MAMESICSLPGRLIPKPAELGTGCGLAWCTELTHRDDLVELMSKNAIKWQDIKVVDIYEYSG